MNIERLVSMANDIGAFFDADSDKTEAAKNVATHLRRFWDPRMRRQIVGYYRDGGAGLTPLARSAIGLIAERR
jgi:formate dehydrogenase subunit delta